MVHLARFTFLIYGTVLLTLGFVISCQQNQPAPVYPFDPGTAEITLPEPIIEPIIHIPTATQNRVLNSPSGQIDDYFGASISITLNTLVVGAPNASGGGAVWVFNLEDPNSTPIKLIPQNLIDGVAYGTSVAISDSGRFIAVGAPKSTVLGKKNSGVVYVWEKKNTQWTISETLAREDLTSNSMLGSTVAINDETLLSGAPFADVLIPYKKFHLNSDTYTTENKVVSAHGMVATWMRDNGSWNEDNLLQPESYVDNAQFGSALSLKGNQVIVGAPSMRASDQIEAGKSFIFLRRKQGWPDEPIVKISQIGNAAFKNDQNTISGNGPNHHFGWAVSILGTVALSGTPEDSEKFTSSGSVNLFQRFDNTAWTQTQYMQAPDPASNDAFGSAVGFAGQNFVIGAPMKLWNNLKDVGAVYIYQLKGGSLQVNNELDIEEEFLLKLLPLQPIALERFGIHLACTPNIIAVCAPGTIGNSMPGQVYIFNRSENSWGVPSPTSELAPNQAQIDTNTP